ncbi:hypothetical protein [Nostoc sp.]|uniref:hypothetical protein n=1 Tax=Nostoc sp. TaxID=1180 RepID=UPI002FFAC90C
MQFPLAIPELTPSITEQQTFPDTITIKAVGDIIRVRMDRQGIPHIDQRFQTVRLMRYLNNQAFPKNPMKINQKGEIVVHNSK